MVESIPTGSSPRWGDWAVGPEKARQLARDNRRDRRAEDMRDKRGGPVGVGGDAAAGAVLANFSQR